MSLASVAEKSPHRTITVDWTRSGVGVTVWKVYAGGTRRKVLALWLSEAEAKSLADHLRGRP